MFFVSRKKIKQEQNARENKAFLEGYNRGYQAGVQDTIFSRITPNQIRTVVGLPPIKDGYFTKVSIIDEITK